jgi:hypothetical protein
MFSVKNGVKNHGHQKNVTATSQISRTCWETLWLHNQNSWRLDTEKSVFHRLLISSIAVKPQE